MKIDILHLMSRTKLKSYDLYKIYSRNIQKGVELGSSYSMKGLHHFYNETQTLSGEFQRVGFQLLLIVFVSFNVLHQSLRGKKTHLLMHLDGMRLSCIIQSVIVTMKSFPTDNRVVHLFISCNGSLKRIILIVVPSRLNITFRGKN